MSDIDSKGFTDPNITPPMAQAIPLGLQHVLAMFASNVTPAIIVSGAAGFAFGGADQVYMIQMAMLFAGIATLFKPSDWVQSGRGYQSCKAPVLHLYRS